MAKRSTKRRARHAPKMYPKGAPTSSSVRARPQREERERQSSGDASATMTSDELREQYWYVYNDLKRIAIISGALFVLLIALAFVI